MQEANTKSIVATNLWDMLVEVQSAVKEGYVLSDKNENFPQSFIGLYTCTLVKEDVTKEETNVVNQETLKELSTEPAKQVTKRGRK